MQAWTTIWQLKEYALLGMGIKLLLPSQTEVGLHASSRWIDNVNVSHPSRGGRKAGDILERQHESVRQRAVADEHEGISKSSVKKMGQIELESERKLVFKDYVGPPVITEKANPS